MITFSKEVILLNIEEGRINDILAPYAIKFQPGQLDTIKSVLENPEEEIRLVYVYEGSDAKRFEDHACKNINITKPDGVNKTITQTYYPIHVEENDGIMFGAETEHTTIKKLHDGKSETILYKRWVDPTVNFTRVQIIKQKSYKTINDKPNRTAKNEDVIISLHIYIPYINEEAK